MEKIQNLIHNFISNPKLITYKSSDYWDKNFKITHTANNFKDVQERLKVMKNLNFETSYEELKKENLEFFKDYPFRNDILFTEEEASNFSKWYSYDKYWKNKETIKFNLPENFFGKKLSIDEHNTLYFYKKDYDYKYEGNMSLGCTTINYNKYENYIIFLKSYGVYFQLGTWTLSKEIQVDKLEKNQSNYFWFKNIKYPNNYLLQEFRQELKYSICEEIFPLLMIELKIRDLTSNLESISNAELKNFNFNVEYTSISSNLNLLNYSEIDFKSLVEKDLKNNIWNPSTSVIKRFFAIYKYAVENSYQLDINDAHKKSIIENTKILKSLGVHTIKLKADTTINIKNLIKLDNSINIEAPKKIIETFNLEKYCKNEDTILKLKEEKEKKLQEEKQKVYNNQFTLSQHGKIIFENKDINILIEYLNNFKFNKKSQEEQLLSSVKPIFDDINIKKLNIGYWGRYTKYESKGEKCYINENISEINDHISEDDLDKINSLYYDNLYFIDEDYLRGVYGGDDEILMLSVIKSKSGKLNIKVSKHDIE